MIERVDRFLYGLSGLVMLCVSALLLASVHGWGGMPDPDALMAAWAQWREDLPRWWPLAAAGAALVLAVAGLFLVWRQIPRPAGRGAGALRIESEAGSTALTPSAAAHLVELAFGHLPGVVAVDGHVLDPRGTPRFAVRCDLFTGASVPEFRQHRSSAEAKLATLVNREAVETEVRLRLDREPAPRVI